jgi:phenylalanyl-tRNA synthetase alpha chain
MSEADVIGRFEAGLEGIASGFAQAFKQAGNEQALRSANARLVGPQGELTALLKLLPEVPKENRREVGQRANRIKGEIAQAFQEKLAALERAAREAELSAMAIDVSLPGRFRKPGRLHPLTRIKHEIIDIFVSFGFDVAEAPEVELYDINFNKLGFPPDHPATDMQDSFFIAQPAGHDPQTTLLRTHTSNVQIREMSRRPPPLAVISPGVCYRRDDDLTHSPMFMQVEGFLVDEGVTFAHLKGILTRFAQRMFGSQVPVRLRPSYFPFVEPGGELDIGCVFCKGWERANTGCRVCKNSGWIEVLGCGMIHPTVFKNVGYDPDRVTGFAFGMGIDRTAMLRYGISDIRTLYENDPRFLTQI